MLLLSIMISITTTAFGKSYELSQIHSIDNQSNVIVTDSGVYINDSYYTKEQFIHLLDTAMEIEKTSNDTTVQSTSAALLAGTWMIPGIGTVVITTTGIIMVGGAIVAVGSWIYNAVVDWFEARAEIDAVKDKIPSRLKDEDGEVDLENFNQKVNGKTAYKEKGGWTIEKDTAGHGGSKWKLKDKSGKRVASLDESGKVLGK